MGICHSDKKKKKENIQKNGPAASKNDQAGAHQKEKEKEAIKNSPPKKNEENEIIPDHTNEIPEEEINNDHMLNLKREFLPQQIYLQHLNSILNHGSNKNICEFGETNPTQLSNGLYSLESYGNYGKSDFL